MARGCDTGAECKLLPTVAALLRSIIAAFGLAALSACATPTKGAFDASQQAFARKQIEPGTGRITGQAFVHPRSGRTYTAGGNWIYLVPVTAYAEERYRNMFGANRFLNVTYFGSGIDKPDPLYEELMHKTKVDMGGRFTFEDVKPGRWYVATVVRWQIKRDRGPLALPDDYAYAIYDEVVVKSDETTKVVLSGN